MESVLALRERRVNQWLNRVDGCPLFASPPVLVDPRWRHAGVPVDADYVPSVVIFADRSQHGVVLVRLVEVADVAEIMVASWLQSPQEAFSDLPVPIAPERRVEAPERECAAPVRRVRSTPVTREHLTPVSRRVGAIDLA